MVVFCRAMGILARLTKLICRLNRTENVCLGISRNENIRIWLQYNLTVKIRVYRTFRMSQKL